VAVVAPVSEVEAAVKDGYKRQFLLQGLIISIIVLAASTLIFIEKRWSRVLELKVRVRTEALKRSEEKYRSLVESAEDFIFTVNLAGKFQSMNSFTANFFGGSSREFLGKRLSTLFFSRKSGRKTANAGPAGI
jgi:PAS domain-containing protein